MPPETTETTLFDKRYSLRKNVTTWLNKEGYSGCVASFVLSGVSSDSLDLVQTLLEISFEGVSCFHESFESLHELTVPSIREWFRDATFPTIEAGVDKEFYGGNVLIFVVGLDDLSPEAVKNGRSTIRGAQGFIRLHFSELFVRSEVLNCIYELKDGQFWPHLWAGPLAPDFRTLMLDHNQDVASGPPYHITAEAGNMLSLIGPRTSKELRFTVLWMALESQLQRFPGKNAGIRRSNFCATLGSLELDKELKRLHGVRRRLFKEADAQAVSFFDEFSLRSFLRLTTFGPSPLRVKFVGIHEQRILDFKDGQTPFERQDDLFLTVKIDRESE